eukprot:jgi/Hompol1/5524/HPOL_001290-RA
MFVLGLRSGRVLASQLGETERNRWIVGSTGIHKDNEITLIDYDEDHDEMSSTSFAHPNEVIGIAPSPTDPKLFFTCARPIRPISQTQTIATLWRFPGIDVDGAGHLRGGSGHSLDQISVLGAAEGLEDIHHKLGIQIKAGQQITCGAWNPHSSQSIAIGVQGSIVGWDIRSNT